MLELQTSYKTVSAIFNIVSSSEGGVVFEKMLQTWVIKAYWRWRYNNGGEGGISVPRAMKQRF